MTGGEVLYRFASKLCAEDKLSQENLEKIKAVIFGEHTSPSIKEAV